MIKPTVAVVGAGIAGMSAAYWLHEAGFSVHVYESESDVAMQTSRANGGQISACNSAVWSTWPQIWKALGWILDPRAPFRIKPTLEWRKMRWLAQFVAETIKSDADDRTTQTIQWVLESAQVVQQITQRHGLQYDQVHKGILHVYDDDTTWRKGQQAKHLFEQAGCDWQILDAPACRELEPSLTYWHNLLGGCYTHHDFTGNMHDFCRQLRQVLTQQGVSFYLNTPVQDVMPHDDHVMVNHVSYDHVVLATGYHVTKLFKSLHLDLGIYPVKGYSVTIQLEDGVSQAHAPWVSLLDERTKIVCTRLCKHELRLAGTAELAGENLDITRARIEPLLDWCADHFPQVHVRNYSSWACLRPMTADQLPRVGQTAYFNRVWLNMAYGHLGWSMAPGRSKWLAHMMAQHAGLKITS